MTVGAVEAYKQAIRRLADLGNLEVWYERVSVDAISSLIEDEERRRTFDAEARKARKRNSRRSFKKLAEIVDGKARLRSDPPLLLPIRDVNEAAELIAETVGTAAANAAPDQETLRQGVDAVYAHYRASVGDELCRCSDRYEIVDAAIKVVGVGSVGTRCFVVLLIGRDEGDHCCCRSRRRELPPSRACCPPAPTTTPGRRVVEGQRLMQAFGDVFLGWADGVEQGRAYYWRQLKDMKWSIDFDAVDMTRLESFSAACGWTLARAHARAGDAVEIAAYVGKGDTFPQAIARFGESTPTRPRPTSKRSPRRRAAA